MLILVSTFNFQSVIKSFILNCKIAFFRPYFLREMIKSPVKVVYHSFTVFISFCIINIFSYFSCFRSQYTFLWNENNFPLGRWNQNWCLSLRINGVSDLRFTIIFKVCVLESHFYQNSLTNFLRKNFIIFVIFNTCDRFQKLAAT